MASTSQNVALVTGATGFIGSELANHLARRGWYVHVIARPKSDLSLLERQAASQDFIVHQYDGSYESLLAAVEGAKPNVVFHLAAAALSEQSFENIDAMLDANVRFGTQLAHSMRRANVINMVNTGTFWQHYNCAFYDPVNLYAATKQAFESLLQFYVNAYGFKIINLKLFDTYGENDPRPKLLNLLKKTSRQLNPLEMSPGEQKLDFVHVEDVASAYEVAAKRLIADKVKGMESYAVSSGRLVTLKALVHLIEQTTGEKLPVQWGRRAYREREVMEPWTARCIPGWSPRISLEHGISRLFNES